MIPTAVGYTTRKYQPQDESGVLELMKLSLGESPTLQRTHALWEWKHLSSPFGPSHVRLACEEAGIPVGMRAFMKWQFQVEDRTFAAVRAVDTATHPDYRRLGIFSTLTTQVVDEVQENGVDLIFNTPNEYSMPGYLNMGWHQVATIQPLVKVLNYPAFALGMVRSRLGKQSPRKHGADEFFKETVTPAPVLLERRTALEELLSQDEQCRRMQDGIRTLRSWEYLYWRYGKHPTIPYWTVCTEDGGQLQSCAIFRANTRFGMKEIVLCELLLSHSDEGPARRLLDLLRASVRAEYLVAYFAEGSLHRRIVDRWGFRAVPGRGMHFTVRPLASNLSPDPTSISSWQLTMGDLELF
jgi:GNAT superfamily N-acetyltransferase